MVLNIVDYQSFRMVVYPSPANLIGIGDAHPLLPASPVHRNPAASHYGWDRVVLAFDSVKPISDRLGASHYILF